MFLRCLGTGGTDQVNLIILPRPGVLVHVDQGWVRRGKDGVGGVPIDVDRIPAQAGIHRC